MMTKRKLGATVTMSDNALENYGDKWRNVQLEIIHVATKYMPAKEFYAQGRPEGFHPGYDGATRDALYDLKVVETGEPLSFSLYEWEVR
jgi:hypothetical protein